MSGEGGGFWTRGKLIGAAIIAMLGAGGGILTFGRGAIAIIDTPANLVKHETEANERMSEFEQMLQGARREICTELNLLPRDCPLFTIERDGR